MHAFNGKEFHTHINWIDYGARFYNPALGRWHNVDAMAETYHTQSPYHFSGNNPVFFIERNGMDYGWGGVTPDAQGTGGGKGDEKAFWRDGVAQFMNEQKASTLIDVFWEAVEKEAKGESSSKNEITDNILYEYDSEQNNAPIVGENKGGNNGTQIPTIEYQKSLNIPYVQQIKSQWCVFACAESLSKYYKKGTTQTTYANTFYNNHGFVLNSNTPVSFSHFVGEAIDFSDLLGFTISASAESIKQSIMVGNPVFTRGDFGAGGHAFIITGITALSNGQIHLQYMNPDPNISNIQTMTYQKFIQIQSTLTRPWAFSVSGVKY